MFEKNVKIKAILASVLVYVSFVVSYLLFSGYQPQALTELREVRGYKIEKEADAFDLPYPRYATGLSTDETSNSKKFTFETDRSPQEVQNFYSNILLGDGWELKKEGALDEFYTSEYRRENLSVKVWSYFDKDIKMTFASVEILKLED